MNRPAAGVGKRRGAAGTCATRGADSLAVERFPSALDPSVCERPDPTGEPGAGKRHAGFGERGEETRLGVRLRHRRIAKAAGQPLLPHAKEGAPLPDSTSRCTWGKFAFTDYSPCSRALDPDSFQQLQRAGVLRAQLRVELEFGPPRGLLPLRAGRRLRRRHRVPRARSFPELLDGEQ